MSEDKDRIIYVPVEDILPNRFQPRLAFDEKELNELAASITKYGVIQPIVLRNIGDKYEIIAGERRYKASVLAGLKKIPAILNNTDDNTSAEIALLENLQRKNLTPIEEAQSFKKLLDRGFKQEEIASKLGISQSAIANKIRLLVLPKKVQDALLFGKISERHARCLISLNNEDLQVNLLNKIIVEKMTVKQTEEEVTLILENINKIKDIPENINSYINSEVKEEKQFENMVELPKEEVVKLPKDDLNNEENAKLKKLLEPEPVHVEEKIEVMDFDNIVQPQVVSIDEPIEAKVEKPIELSETISDDASINPFQTNNEPKNEEIDFTPINNELINNNYISEEPKNEKIEDTKYTVPDDKIINDDGSINLPNIIDKVRNFVGDLNAASSLISTTELDLDDKYQIIIEIEKDTQ